MENINEDNITLWKQREAVIFRRNDESAYESDGESMIMTPEGIYNACKNIFFSVALSFIGISYYPGNIFVYLFDSTSGRLIRVGSFIHNVTLNLQYSVNRLQSIEHSESGKRLSVNYTIFDRIQSIELLSADSTVEKTR